MLETLEDARRVQQLTAICLIDAGLYIATQLIALPEQADGLVNRLSMVAVDAPGDRLFQIVLTVSRDFAAHRGTPPVLEVYHGDY